jgi:isopropylmalate/homocitrate/citramalate synthase
MKYSYTYESFPPEILGRKRNIVLGKHSGKASIKLFLKKYGIICNEEEIFKILEKVKTFSEIKKRCISSKEFLDIVSDIKNNKIVNKSS